LEPDRAGFGRHLGTVPENRAGLRLDGKNGKFYPF
jgi:hypothetical protein